MIGWLSRLPRRVTMFVLVIAAAVLVTMFAPLLFAVAAIVDIATGSWQARPRLRTLLFVWMLLLNQLFGITSLILLWVATGFGLAMHSPWSYSWHGRLHGRWTRNVLRATEFCFATSVEIDGMDCLEPGPVVVLARHISLLDAVIPSVLLTAVPGHAPRHVFMRELRFDPCIDTLGHRIPNHLVDRVQGGEKELRAIAAVGATLDERGSGVIFPEGGFRTDERFARALTSLEKRNPVLADRARGLSHVMPPRPGGAWALMNAAPHADLVVLAHRGFDGVSTIADIVRGQRLPPIEVKLSRWERSAVPSDVDDFALWLFDRFAEVDEWVDQRLG